MWASKHQVGVPKTPCTLPLGMVPLLSGIMFRLKITDFEDETQTTVP